MIFNGSRYETASVVRVPDSSGALNPAIFPAPPSNQRFQYTEYTVQFGERIDNIAATELGDPSMWWMIAHINPEVLSWDNLDPGTVLRIPLV